MADNNFSQVRQLAGAGQVERRGPFRLIEASVADGTALVIAGAVANEGGLPEPVVGWIVGMVVGCEASADFPLTPSIDTVDAAAAYDLAVAGAEARVIYNTPLEFAAGVILGVNVDGTVTTAKDVQAELLVVSNWGLQ